MTIRASQKQCRRRFCRVPVGYEETQLWKNWRTWKGPDVHHWEKARSDVLERRPRKSTIVAFSTALIKLDTVGFLAREFWTHTTGTYGPVLFLTDNATQISVSGIRMLKSPCWTIFLVRTKEIAFDNVRINAFSTNIALLPKDTDGMHIATQSHTG